MPLKMLVPSVFSIEVVAGSAVSVIYPKASLGKAVRKQHSKVTPSMEYKNDFHVGWKLLSADDSAQVQLPNSTVVIEINPLSIAEIVRHHPCTPFSETPLQLCELTRMNEVSEYWLVSENSLASLKNRKDAILLDEEKIVDIQDINEGDVVMVGTTPRVVSLVLRTEREDHIAYQLELSVSHALNKKTFFYATTHKSKEYSATLYRVSEAQGNAIPFLKYLYFFSEALARGMYEVQSTRNYVRGVEAVFQQNLAALLREKLKTGALWTEVPIAEALPQEGGQYSHFPVTHLLRWSELTDLWEAFSEDAIVTYFSNNSELVIGNDGASVILGSNEKNYPELRLHLTITRSRRKGLYSLRHGTTLAMYLAITGEEAPKELTAQEVSSFIQKMGQRTFLCSRTPAIQTSLLRQLNLLS